MNLAAPETSRTMWRLGNLLVWLGGGSWRDIGDDAERSSYVSTGFLVLLNALITWGVTTLVVVGVLGANPLVALPFTAVCGLLVAVFGRVLASTAAERGSGRAFGDLSRGLVAVLIGVVVGELAALAIFTGPIECGLNAQVDAARAGVAQSERGRQLDGLRDDRAALDTRVNDAIARRDQARVVARCEYNPTPGCPSGTITGDPGRGNETVQAEQALADAERDLADARAQRGGQVPSLDAEIARVDGQLAADRTTAEALARADTGVDARWRAMHDYTTGYFAALVLRLGVLAFFVVLNLLPLLLRVWRGQTEQDRRIEARRLRERAEEEADTAIAVRRAEVRAALGLREQEALLDAPAGARQPLTVATAERTEPLALTSGTVTEGEPSDNLPVPVGDRGVLAITGKELEPKQNAAFDKLPGPLPMMARALTGAVRPLVPEQVSRLASSPPKAIRVARTLLEEVEEFSFSLTHKRKVIITEEKPEGEQVGDEQGRQALRRSAVASRILDEAGESRASLEHGEHRDELAAAELRARRELPLGEELPALSGADHRELPAGARRALPPGGNE